MNKRITAALPGMEIVEVQVSANVSLPTNSQRRGNLTMFWEGEVLVEEPGKPPVRFGPGEILYHPPLFACAETFVANCIMVTVEIDAEKSRELLTVLADPLAPARFSTKQSTHITAGIRRELHDSRRGRSMVLSSLVTQLVVMGARSAEEAKGIPDFIQRARQMIRADYGSSRSLAEIARVLGVSREHIARTFRCHVGMTISEFVRAVRIDRSKELLANPALCISTVALRSGFYDQSHMTRTFRKTTGMTPREYRRSLFREEEDAATASIAPAADWTGWVG